MLLNGAFYLSRLGSECIGLGKESEVLLLLGFKTKLIRIFNENFNALQHILPHLLMYRLHLSICTFHFLFLCYLLQMNCVSLMSQLDMEGLCLCIITFFLLTWSYTNLCETNESSSMFSSSTCLFTEKPLNTGLSMR